MAAKIFILCASALMVQSVLGGLILPPPSHHGLSAASAAAAASAGVAGCPLVAVPDLSKVVLSGPLLVTSISPIAPIGLSVTSENKLEALLEVTGILPFASAVAFDGALDTAGSGTASCGCGSGTVGITEINCK